MYVKQPQPGDEEIAMQPDGDDHVDGGDNDDDDDNEVVRRKTIPPRQSVLWRFFGKRVPRSEIVFFFQMFLIYVVVGVSIYQLCQGTGPKHLWVSLLSSAIGYSLPNPTLDRHRRPTG